MHARRRSRHAFVLSLLVSLLVLVVSACTSALKESSQQSVPLTLSNSARTSSGPVSLEVGTNRWPTPGTSVEETFLPLAVTVHNTGDQSLCGGVSTAILSDASGTSVSALFPEGVVTRLFGSFASLEPQFRPVGRATTFTDRDAALLFVHGIAGGFGGGMNRGIGRFYRGHSGGFHLRPAPRPPIPSPFSSPFRSPSPLYPGSLNGPFGGMSPGSSRFLGTLPRPPYMSPSPRVFAPPCPASPFASPFAPLPPSPLSPWYNPFPPLSPYSSFPYHYGYAPSLPYGYPPLLPPDVRPREKEQQRIDQTLIKEILTTAFASRALASQEERSGFLFFLLPLPHIGTTMLTWDWYDCDTQALVAHLIAPIAVERHT